MLQQHMGLLEDPELEGPGRDGWDGAGRQCSLHSQHTPALPEPPALLKIYLDAVCDCCQVISPSHFR